MREQLDKGINANVRSPSDGSTALLEAAAGGHLSVCRLVLHRQADINACNNHNQSPLHAAAIAGHSAVCKLLIDKHADVSIASVWVCVVLVAALAHQCVFANTIMQAASH